MRLRCVITQKFSPRNPSQSLGPRPYTLLPRPCAQRYTLSGQAGLVRRTSVWGHLEWAQKNNLTKALSRPTSLGCAPTVAASSRESLYPILSLVPRSCCLEKTCAVVTCLVLAKLLLPRAVAVHSHRDLAPPEPWVAKPFWLYCKSSGAEKGKWRRNPACNNMCSKCFRECTAAEERKASTTKQALAAISESQQAPPAASQELPGVAEPSRPAPPLAEAPASHDAQRLEGETVVNSRMAAASTSGTPETADGRPPQKNPGRCFACNKRVGLTGFKCRCEYIFCAAHRLAESHECPFDYKSMERKRLAQNNPLILASKVDKL